MKIQEVHDQILSDPPLLSIVVLNWNRFDLLRGTVLSLLASTYCPIEMIIVDNGSTDFSVPWLKLIADKYMQIELILLEENQGGEALNLALKKTTGEFVLISENDLEYLPRWDFNMLTPFYLFKNLGQISPFSPFPQESFGEVWTQKTFSPIHNSEMTLNLAVGNVGTTSLIRRDIINRGARWSSLTSKANEFKFPADGPFSQQVRDFGYLVAWSNEYQVINWGHNKNIINANISYYHKNWQAKAENDIDGLTKFESPSKTDVAISSEEQVTQLKSELGFALQELDSLKKQVKLYKIAHPEADLAMVMKEKTTLFVDTGDDFSQSQIVKCELDTNSESFNLYFDVSDFSNIKRLRWDPIEGFLCQVKINKIYLQTTDEKLSVDSSNFNTNAVRCSKGWWIFESLDPMFIFNSIPGKINGIRIVGNWKFSC